ncbi:MAG: acyl--CoA ligase [Proteobacteria bacterium]|nr:acyl--CoA ligase [Pseudomonadota bacterium]
MPWEKEYKVFGIPKTLTPYPDEPVFHALDVAAKKYKKQGLIQFNYKMTYPEVKDHADRLATALAGMGLKKGDRVATLLPTSIQFIVADFGISKAGLVHIPGSSLEPFDTLEHKFNEGTPKVLICMAENSALAKSLMESTSVETVILTEIEDYSPNPPVKVPVKDIEGGLWLTELIAKTAPNPPHYTYDVEKDLELLLFTGGTTGLPKGCMLTHRNIYANAIQSLHGFGAAGKLMKGAISVLLGLPLFHAYGHLVMHSMVVDGYNQILIPDARDTKSMVEMIRTYYPVIQMGVPTQFLKITDESLDGIGILGVSGSAPLPPNTQKKFEEKSGGGVMEGYGLSEMSPCTHLNTSFLLRLLGGRTPVKFNNMFLCTPGVAPSINWFLRKLGSKNFGFMMTRGVHFLVNKTKKETSSGRKNEKRGTTGILFPDTEVKLIDIDTGEKLSVDDIFAGKKGEMCLKGPQRMLGYWPEPGKGLDDEGYVRTGDVVTVDEHGYFYIVDRTKDMINVSGYKVYSREIDDILYSYPGAEHAATVGVPDPEREGSERVVVYIQPKPEYKGKIKEEDVIEFLKSKIAKYAVPKMVRFVDEMPLTEVQKLNKKVIRQMAIEEYAK